MALLLCSVADTRADQQPPKPKSPVIVSLGLPSKPVPDKALDVIVTVKNVSDHRLFLWFDDSWVVVQKYSYPGPDPGGATAFTNPGVSRGDRRSQICPDEGEVFVIEPGEQLRKVARLQSLRAPHSTRVDYAMQFSLPVFEDYATCKENPFVSGEAKFQFDVR